MRTSRPDAALRSVLLCVALLFVASAAPLAAQQTKYSGEFVLKPNGDMGMVIKITLPMAQYQALRQGVGNPYLLLRDTYSNRSEAEATGQRAEWDDSSRSVTLSLTELGAARNMGNRWEVEVPEGTIFSNLDEAKRTFYFNESGAGMMGGSVQGTSRLTLPPGAQEMKWDEGRRIVSYVLPAPKAPGGSPGLLIVGILLIVLGAVAVAASFVPRSAPAAAAKS